MCWLQYVAGMASLSKQNADDQAIYTKVRCPTRKNEVFLSINHARNILYTKALQILKSRTSPSRRQLGINKEKEEISSRLMKCVVVTCQRVTVWIAVG